jgi:hypothetical protein
MLLQASNLQRKMVYSCPFGTSVLFPCFCKSCSIYPHNLCIAQYLVCSWICQLSSKDLLNFLGLKFVCYDGVIISDKCMNGHRSDIKCKLDLPLSRHILSYSHTEYRSFAKPLN